MTEKKPYDWSWEELEEHLSIFDHVEVNFFDGGKHKPFGGDSGVSVLRVTDISPMKRADGKLILHVSTDSNWFGEGRHRIFSDEYIEKTIDQAVDGMVSTMSPDGIKEIMRRAFGIGVEPAGQPYITSSSED